MQRIVQRFFRVPQFSPYLTTVVRVLPGELSHHTQRVAAMTAGGSAFWVYVLENETGRYYVGSTDDLDRRLAEHNDPANSRVRYTAKHAPWRLVWSESHATRASAVRRERQIKRMKSARWIRNSLLATASDRSVDRLPARCRVQRGVPKKLS